MRSIYPQSDRRARSNRRDLRGDLFRACVPAELAAPGDMRDLCETCAAAKHAGTRG